MIVDAEPAKRKTTPQEPKAVTNVEKRTNAGLRMSKNSFATHRSISLIGPRTEGASARVA